MAKTKTNWKAIFLVAFGILWLAVVLQELSRDWEEYSRMVLNSYRHVVED
jgi:hypothetical protein